MKKIAFFVIAVAPLLFSAGSKPKAETSTTAQYLKDYNAGVQAQKDQDYQGAISYYLNALGQKSDFPEAWNNLGFCYRMTAKSYLAKAGDAYGKALKYSPKHEEAIEYQGEYFVMVGQLKNAYQNYLTLKQMNSSEADELKEKLDEVLKQAQAILQNYTP